MAGLTIGAWLAESVLTWQASHWAGLDLTYGQAVVVTAVAVGAAGSSEGLGRGMDQELIAAVCAAVPVPVIAAGGAASAADIAGAAQNGASAVALSSLLHYGRATVGGLKDELEALGVEVRR